MLLQNVSTVGSTIVGIGFWGKLYFSYSELSSTDKLGRCHDFFGNASDGELASYVVTPTAICPNFYRH